MAIISKQKLQQRTAKARAASAPKPRSAGDIDARRPPIKPGQRGMAAPVGISPLGRVL